MLGYPPTDLDISKKKKKKDLLQDFLKSLFHRHSITLLTQNIPQN